MRRVRLGGGAGHPTRALSRCRDQSLSLSAPGSPETALAYADGVKERPASLRRRDDVQDPGETGAEQPV
jgi:hypothetical protein